MGRKAIKIEEQITKLEQRGMVFDLGKEKAEEVLLDIGYYRLGFYWNPFEKDRSHNFEDGTKFSNVLNLYYLDVDLRNILLEALKRVEINFRTSLIYYTSNEYDKSPAWFSDSKVMKENFINNLNKQYNNDFKRFNKTIKKHHDNYPNDKLAPAWKTLEYFTFGAVIKVFRAIIDDNVKLKISNRYNISSPSKFNNYLDTLKFLRNTCAHGGVIFDLILPQGVASTPILEIDNSKRHSLDSCIRVLSHFIMEISTNRGKEFNEKINKKLNSYRDDEELNKIILEKICFDNKPS